MKPTEFLFFELYTKTGYSLGNPQRLDAFHMAELPCSKFKRTAYEIKVTRRDFLAEVKCPAKRAAAMGMSNEFYFVTPLGLVNAIEVPIGCGLIQVSDDSRYSMVIKSPLRETKAPSWALTASMVRHAMRKM